MSVYKDPNNNTWKVLYRMTDWKGDRKQSTKRGFKTKREALEWEREFLCKKQADLDMTFESFVDIYKEDMKNRIKGNTWQTKDNIIRTKLIPYFGKRKLNQIQPRDVIAWQNAMLEFCDENGNNYSPVYLKTLHNQLSAIFNHAVKYYNLQVNPAAKVGNMGKPKNKEMLFWTHDEYKLFAEAIMDKPVSFYAFETLYYTGIRIGELLALTLEDINFENGTLRINKSYQRLNGRDIITDPKTPKSNRVIQLPDFLVQELKDHTSRIYGLKETDRIFNISKNYLHREMTRGSKIAGVKRIRIHDIRHSFISLMLQYGFTTVDVADHVGHESINITLNYSHIFPSTRTAMAKKLDDLNKEEK